MFLFLFLFAVDQPSPFSLDTLPEDSDVFITTPRDLHIDRRGWVHILDQGSRRILIWDDKGRFQNSIGRSGEGPGEFAFFDHQHPHQSTVSKSGNHWLVYDDGTRSFSRFDSTWRFVEKTPLALDGSPMWARAITPNRLLVRSVTRGSSGSETLLSITDDEGQFLETLIRVPNPMSGPDRSILAFSADLIGRFDPIANQIVAGFGADTHFSVYDLEGNKLASHRVVFAPAPVIADEKRAYRNNNKDSFGDSPISFPDEHPRYSDVLTLGRKGYLVYRQDYLSGVVIGAILDREGKTRSPFSLAIGESGRLMGSGGKVLAAKVDEDGSYHFEELTFDVFFR